MNEPMDAVEEQSHEAVLFVLPGANMRPEDIAILEGLFRSAVKDKKLGARLDVVVSRWRERSGVTLGAFEGTMPRFPSWRLRDVLVDTGRFLGSTIRYRSWRAAVANLGQRQRKRTITKLSQFLGDVMSYNRHRGTIFDEVRKELEKLSSKRVIAIGHSLGGIILVDLMAEAPPSNVRAVVTVGSQAPFMYALDALISLPYGKGHRPFTPWVNVWDRHDYLSFLARDVFKTDVDSAWPILDVEVASGVGIRAAHSAYWTQPGTWASVMLAMRHALTETAGAPDTRTNQDVTRPEALPDGEINATEAFNCLHRARQEAVTALLADGEIIRANIALAQAAVHQMLAKTRHQQAAVALHMIRHQTIEAHEIERTQTKWYRYLGVNYAIEHGRIDEATASGIPAKFASLRPIDGPQDDEPWLELIADSPGAVTDEARSVLAASGVEVFFQAHSSDQGDLVQ
jgi:hypothetical protein